MFIILYDNDIRIKKKVVSTYKYKGINIFKSDDDYYFKFDYPYYLDESNKIEFKKYQIKNNERLNEITIFIYDSDDGIDSFNFYQRKDFNLSFNKYAEIETKDEYLENINLSLNEGLLEADYEYLEVNNKRCENCAIKNGDFISLLGIEIYIYDEFLYINSFKNQVNIKKADLIPKSYVFKNEKPKILNHYKSDLKEIKINEVKPFKGPHKNNDKKIIYQIGPSLTMSLAMGFVAFINIYNSYINNGFSLSLIALGVMPLTIMFSGILWPLLSRTSDNKKYKKEYLKAKNRYLNYLKEYEKDTLNDLNSFKDNENYYRFNTSDIYNKLFFISNLSKMFMTINIGNYTKDFVFNYELSGDEEIDNYLISLKNKIANVGNIPLYIDLNKNKRVSIISDNYLLILRKILLELAYKYSNNDLFIALYIENAELFEQVYNLPHLFSTNSRLLFNNDAQLSILSCLNNKPIVLLTDKEINFDLDKLSIIKFCQNRNSLLSNSSAIIEDNDNLSSLDSNDHKQLFMIEKPNVDYSIYFEYLSRIGVPFLLEEPLSFVNANISLDIKDNYLKHDHSLMANFASYDGTLLPFDLHESKEGPHGLIGGSTGSGKSELIISLLLSLALRYPSDYLNFILIDYKGGGIKESLSYNGQALPHIIASIDNLEGDSLLRLLIVIDAELKKRERLFKDLSNKSHNSIMSIDEYLNINEDYDFPKMAHLVILVDEFAELKKQNPELIKELVSFSRIGRSLGMHLILATQKPNGVIDEEIWSNSHFKIALKVHDEKDSKEIIRSKEAAYLTNPGEFYLNVDTTLRKARAIYAKQDVNNNGRYELGILNKRLDYSYKRIIRNKNSEYESTYLCGKILEATEELKFKTNYLSFKKPEAKNITELVDSSCANRLIMGESDDYLRLKRGLLTIDSTNNIFIYSSRRKEINNIIYELNRIKHQTIVISDKKYHGEMLSDVISYDNDSDLSYLFMKLFNDNVNELTLVIENLNVLLSYDEKYLEIIQKLLKRSKLSKYNLIAISDNSLVNYKLLNSFETKLVIDINDRQELVNIFGVKGEYLGKSFYFDETPIPFVETKIIDILDRPNKINPYLEKIPKLRPIEITGNDILIGYIKRNRNKYYVSRNNQLLITSFDDNLLNKYRRIFNFLNIIIERYDNSLCLNNYRYILWTGEGIYSQRFFYPEKNIELAEDEGYLYADGKGEIIKLINNEPDNNSFFQHS